MSFYKKVTTKYQILAGDVIPFRTLNKKKPLIDAPAKVKATILSVLMQDKDGKLKSVTTFVEIKPKGKVAESANLTLRFDQGTAATLCGYPIDWNTWDEPDVDVFITKEIEREIFKQLEVSLQKQFKGPHAEDALSDTNKNLAITMLRKAINKLN